ncbi:SoxR reducing system RseC family protein [Treponema sp.]|uniref:SoxR reducing system RseC family protein n=1 Tax=Treponema sp. TaxID=166 RepID=UPI0025D13233|nr:SoxR reducing system RseC family protein [Treponema sp.]MCR5218867.1 SoxR reducing system RseC family protein [Treponema sp.]
MNKKALIVSTENQILVQPLLKDSCAGCTSSCEKTDIRFAVTNPMDLPVKAGSVVTLAASPISQAVQGILGLFFPIFSAIAGYFLADKIALKLNLAQGDKAKSLCVLIFLLASSLLVFIVTRLFPLPGTPQIINIEEDIYQNPASC